jgi:ABC-type multidrug transport system ATPase subunit
MLEITDLSVFYGQVQALNRVSVKVKEGELVALVGPNGAGKSTLLKTISGLLNPKNGTITFLGGTNRFSASVRNSKERYCPFIGGKTIIQANDCAGQSAFRSIHSWGQEEN